MISQLSSAHEPMTSLSSVDGSVDLGKVLEFYGVAATAVYPALKLFLQESNKRYIFTGHSMGGALATIISLKAAVDFQVSC